MNGSLKHKDVTAKNMTARSYRSPDWIQTHPANDAYRDGWERTFGKKNKNANRHKQANSSPHNYLDGDDSCTLCRILASKAGQKGCPGYVLRKRRGYSFPGG